MSKSATLSDESHDEVYSDGETDDSRSPLYIELDPVEADIEAFEFKCLTLEQTDDLFRPSTSAQAGICKERLPPVSGRARSCPICYERLLCTRGHSLDCGHQFCADCWTAFLEAEIGQGRSKDIACMSPGCEILAPMDFVLRVITPRLAHLESRYVKLYREASIRLHPQLVFCPGVDCETVIKVQQVRPKRVDCYFCGTQFCCSCGGDYHAPASCEEMRLWSTEVSRQTDSERYVRINTKKCPNCRVPIEKNSGCMHMTCTQCRHEFCWTCGGNWRTHGGNCGEYNEDFRPGSVDAEREAFRMYSRFSDRWNTQARALRLTGGLRERIRNIVNERIAANEGTSFGWQYLFDAVDVLQKCRSTLLYSYPHAYYLDSEPQRLFEFHQSNLATEIQSLSRKLEAPEFTWREDIVPQLALAEKYRTLLLIDWLKT